MEHALPKETALALASAAEKIGFDLLLFGEAPAIFMPNRWAC